MAKFKKRDRVRAIRNDEDVVIGATGTVIDVEGTEDGENDLVKWDAAAMVTKHGKRTNTYRVYGAVPVHWSILELSHTIEAPSEPTNTPTGDFISQSVRDTAQMTEQLTDAHSSLFRELSLSEPSTTPETGPAPGTEEWWRWTIATEAMQGILASGIYASNDNSIYISKPKEIASRCVDAVQWADALIAELKGGKP